MDIDIQSEFLLDLDALVDLTTDELLVLSLGDFTLGELVTLDTDLLGLGERTDGGGGEGRKAEVLLLLRITVVEAGLTVVHLSRDLRLALLDLRVVGTLGLGTRLHGSSVGIKLRLDGGRAGSERLSKDRNFAALLDGEGEPLVDLLGKLLLAGKGVGNVKEGAGGGNNNTVLAKSLNGTLEQLKAVLEVVLPDVTSVNNTSGQNLLRTKLLDNSIQLLRVTDKVDVKSMEVGKGRDNVKVVNNVTEVGSDGDLGTSSAEGADGLVGRLESILDGGPQIENEDGLINLHPFTKSDSGCSVTRYYTYSSAPAALRALRSST